VPWLTPISTAISDCFKPLFLGHKSGIGGLGSDDGKLLHLGSPL
jgi:hypothetical protein